jgi:hypothetical protein
MVFNAPSAKLRPERTAIVMEERHDIVKPQLWGIVP